MDKNYSTEARWARVNELFAHSSEAAHEELDHLIFGCVSVSQFLVGIVDEWTPEAKKAANQNEVSSWETQAFTQRPIRLDAKVKTNPLMGGY